MTTKQIVLACLAALAVGLGMNRLAMIARPPITSIADWEKQQAAQDDPVVLNIHTTISVREE